jgi:hypothetical protein
MRAWRKRENQEYSPKNWLQRMDFIATVRLEIEQNRLVGVS